MGWANTPHLEHLNITTTIITLTLGAQRTEHEQACYLRSVLFLESMHHNKGRIMSKHLS